MPKAPAPEVDWPRIEFESAAELLDEVEAAAVAVAIDDPDDAVLLDEPAESEAETEADCD